MNEDRVKELEEIIEQLKKELQDTKVRYNPKRHKKYQ